jgi:hypothetical protein
VSHADASRVAGLPAVSIMFAALLGYNPIQTLLGPAIDKLPASHAAYLTGHTFFPSLISAPFEHGLSIAFDFSIAACVIAAIASLLRGGRYVHELHGAQLQGADAGEAADVFIEALPDPQPQAELSPLAYAGQRRPAQDRSAEGSKAQRGRRRAAHRAASRT